MIPIMHGSISGIRTFFPITLLENLFGCREIYRSTVGKVRTEVLNVRTQVLNVHSKVLNVRTQLANRDYSVQRVSFLRVLSNFSMSVK